MLFTLIIFTGIVILAPESLPITVIVVDNCVVVVPNNVLIVVPDNVNEVTIKSALAYKSAKFRFYGISAHAAAQPDQACHAIDLPGGGPDPCRA